MHMLINQTAEVRHNNSKKLFISGISPDLINWPISLAFQIIEFETIKRLDNTILGLHFFFYLYKNLLIIIISR